MLEACVDSVKSALNAQAGGADRAAALLESTVAFRPCALLERPC